MWFGTENGLARFDGRRIQKFAFGDAEANRILALRMAPTRQLWIGTGNGAFVYSDGRFQPVEGTQGVAITTILPGPEVFLGTDAGQVLQVDPDTKEAITAGSMYPDPIVSADGSPLPITSLIEDDGQLLAATSGRGVFTVQPGAVAEYPTSPRPVFANSLARDGSGNLWFGADAAKGLSGIYKADNGSRADAYRHQRQMSSHLR